MHILASCNTKLFPYQGVIEWVVFGQVKRRILMGTYALSAGYYDAFYKRAQQV
jgi:hypothetical protein